MYPISVKRNVFEPLHLQIRREIERQIDSDAIPAGNFLPSEKQLAETLQVNRHTVRKAYEELRRAGVVEAQQGQGWRVVGSRRMLPPEIGFLVTGTKTEKGEPVYRRIFHGLTVQAHSRDVYVTHFVFSGDNGADVVRAISGRRLAALVVGGRIAPEVWEPVLALPLRRIGVNTVPDNPCAYYVVTNNREGGRVAARKLLEAGHERFGLILPRKEIILATNEFKDRRAGFLEVLHDASIPDSSIFEGELDVLEPDSQISAARNLAAFGTGLGVFCAFDRIAFSLMAVLHNMGIRVPDDMSIVGFDGDQAGMERTPTLATLEQDVDEIARNVIDLVLHEQESGEPGPGIILVPPHFRPGGTLRVPAGEASEAMAEGALRALPA